ncbi:DUF6308 family protein [Mycobacterium marinum]|uniref:DUF6308 family protein n=1 Tax=Mycobacterium marinum TaxID=1781 RepID=UPI000E3B89B7|nr:DUF6308 family protein [Mycobacterium marinum]RFZ66520.1 hypothetical protein DE4576_02674 [Mycobacterium marinum]GJN98641.1 hypothetical protein NJB18091_28180 [Mycobacterium marinum]GJO32048.1 hypothetical protein NJB1507_41710 [Mycobacterium marinum]
MSTFRIDLGDWFSDNAAPVQRNLRRYFQGAPGDLFTGRWFETFAAMSHPDRFEASDLLAVEALSVNVNAESAAELLISERRTDFNALLAQIPADDDLWELDRTHIGAHSPAGELFAALKTLDGVGYVKAGKLMAAKRPRLIPILDRQVRELLKPATDAYWATMHTQLSDDAVRNEIDRVCATAPDGVSLLRRMDVAFWMHATQR